MTSSDRRDRCAEALRCKGNLGVPFIPAIYEHKAWLIQDTPSRVCRDVELLYRAIMTEYEQVEPDALVIGMDLYNVEAEAAGCTVTFYDGDDVSTPGIAPGDHVVRIGDDVASRFVPNPLTDGRMPINIEVARRVVQALGDQVWVRGGLTGPFTLAVNLMGATELFLGLIDHPEFIHAILAYAARIIKQYGEAYVDVGADVVMFDSQASSELLSPRMYHEFVLPVTKKIVSHFQKCGLRDMPLVIGGNNTPICEDLIATGANNLLCDFKDDWPTWLTKCRIAGRAVRRNLDPRFIQDATPDVIYEAVKRMIAEADGYPGFMAGTAVVPFGTRTENLIAVRQACREAG